MKNFDQLTVEDSEALVFGWAPHSLKTRHGMVLGGGTVYPELNFTLPPMNISRATMPVVRDHYERIIAGALKRAADLEADGVQIEFETLPPMTEQPEWGAELCGILLEQMEEAHTRCGLRSVLRITPNDTREKERPPRMRSGELFENMMRLFEMSAKQGAELLSIESVGGKELHDEALMNCDIQQVIFALCVLGVRDMRFLWEKIASIAAKHGVHAAGDTACGFGNTAMVLADKQMIPKVFAAVVRAVTAVRSLAAYECGAVGPGKDCGYENIILKAITGFPMAMEGKTAACAHLSHVGNIAAAAADLWSNESVQHVRLLADMAPTCYLEQLIYDCRLMNRARAEGRDAVLTLRRWMVDSDAPLDPQAFILSPDSAVRLARAIVDEPDAYRAGRSAAMACVRLLKRAHMDRRVKILDRELPFLDIIEAALDDMPDGEEAFISSMMNRVPSDTWLPGEYGL